MYSVNNQIYHGKNTQAELSLTRNFDTIWPFMNDWGFPYKKHFQPIHFYNDTIWPIMNDRGFLHTKYVKAKWQLNATTKILTAGRRMMIEMLAPQWMCERNLSVTNEILLNYSSHPRKIHSNTYHMFSKTVWFDAA